MILLLRNHHPHLRRLEFAVICKSNNHYVYITYYVWINRALLRITMFGKSIKILIEIGERKRSDRVIIRD